MSHPNFLIVILSCYNNRYLWDNLLKYCPDQSIVFYGNEDQCEEFILKDHILSLKCGDTYECLPEKIVCMVHAIRSINQFKDVKHIFKIDDHDTKFDNSLIEKLNCLFSQSLSLDYAGQLIHSGIGTCRTWHINKCTPTSIWNNKPYDGPYVSWTDGGHGYILSRRSMDIICEKYGPSNIKDIRETHIYEDVMISLILHEKHIFPTQIDAIIVGDK
jgi:hypothetical protein